MTRPRRLPEFVSRQVTTARRWFLDLRPAAGQSLTAVCGGFERVRRDYSIQRADFPYHCVEFVAAGAGEVVLGDRQFPLGAGSVFSYGPAISHRITTDRRRPLRKYYVDFVGRDAAARLRAAGLAPGSHVAVSQPREIRAVFDLLQQCGLAHSSHSQSLCVQLLGVLLTKITERALPPGNADLHAFTTFTGFRDFLTRERQRLVTVEQAAAEYGLSPAYVCRLFRRFAGTSPYQFLVRQRMNLAADLLTHERMQVRQAADRLGFADAYQFSRAFKRVAGVSPREFQRKN